MLAVGSVAGLLIFKRGVPFSWQLSLTWIVALLLVIRPRLRIQRLVRDWLPLLAIVLAYEWVRGLIFELHRPVNYTFPISADRALFGTLPVVWLQRKLLNPSRPALWEIGPALLYASHFVLPIAIGAWLYVKQPERWRLYRVVVAVAFGIALLGYVLFPVAPPWMASELGLIPPILRSSARGWTFIGLPIARDFTDYGVHYGNPVAAMPSVHAALPVVYLIVLWPSSRWPLRVILSLYAISMSFSLVLGGEHYFIDVVAGWATAVVASLVGLVVLRHLDGVSDRGARAVDVDEQNARPPRFTAEDPGGHAAALNPRPRGVR